MTSYTRSMLMFMTAMIIFQIIVVIVADLDRPYWGDEAHFVKTVNSFGEEISIDSLKHYEEMSTPLPFVVYALWGRMVGFEIDRLRLLSILIAMLTYMLFHRLLFESTGSVVASVLGSMFLVAHPYMVGFSIFVFTDMLPIMFLITSLLSIRHDRPWLLGLSLAGALLCRQYFVFLSLAMLAFYVLRLLDKKRTIDIKMIWATVLAHLPVIGLFILWGGVTPDNLIKATYLKYSIGYHPSYFVLYVCLTFLFLLPLLIYRFRTIYLNRLLLLISAAICWVYWIVPVGPALPAVEVGIPTVGLFHKLLRYTLGGASGEHIVFFAAFCLGLPVLLFVFNDTRERIRTHHYDLPLSLNLIVVAFFVVMPFSYLGWEKYFIPLVPTLILRLMLTVHDPLT